MSYLIDQANITRRHLFVGIGLIISLTFAPLVNPAIGSGGESHTASHRLAAARRRVPASPREAFSNLPLSFEANRGQVDSRLKFLARGDGYTLFLTRAEAVLALRVAAPALRSAGSRDAIDSSAGPQPAIINPRPCALRMRFAGAESAPRVAGEDELAGKNNYFTGSDPREWRTNVATYKSVRYYGLYPGIDLVYYGNQRQLEYDFIVAAGANPGAIRVSFEGADRLEIDAGGALVIHTEAGRCASRSPSLINKATELKKRSRAATDSKAGAWSPSTWAATTAARS